MKRYWSKALLAAFPLIIWLFLSQKQTLPDSYVGSDISTILAVMPKSDRNKLEYFFRELIAWEGFGYVLLGEKPMALGVIDKAIHPFASLSGFKHAIIPRRIKLVRGFHTWKKYEKFFPTSQFHLFYEEDVRSNVLITLVNKTTFAQTMEKYAEDFKMIFNRDVKAEELLKEGDLRPFLSDILMDHDAVIGILLGYGRENAFLFHQKSQLASDEEREEFCEKFQFNGIWTEEEFQNFCKQYASIGWVSHYITGSHMKNLELMALPSFVAVLASPETQCWRKHYLETKQAIIEYYKDKDFLESTLRLLTS